ncbi:hypothetical protein G7046_g8071 [Stylonectria norvegica]|nr:hypothetical protein G7046_g8071 [Stylonectria norvegica]
MDVPAHRFLLVNELWEMILLHLELRTLLISAPLVSRQWHELIQTSPKIQEMVFLKPIVAEPVAGEVNPIRNPFIEGREQSRRESWTLLAFDERVQKAYELARKQGTPLQTACPSLPPSLTYPLLFPGNDQAFYKTGKFTRPESSWRKMLVQQPPITSFGLILLRDDSDATITVRAGKAECPDGVRLGQVWDTLRHNMGPLMNDFDAMRLVWWKPTICSLERVNWPLKNELERLFEDGAQLVLELVFREPLAITPREQMKEECYSPLCKCNDYEPLDFKLKQTGRWDHDAQRAL